ncbi:UDP-N-acetylmuramoylalanyl-D-glutamate--2,6-diaminopimelate ligase [Helicobacter sp. 13S00401-1]|uniref:UDP-N-acetylmuramoyl-L-alanyl-D-glutamate--2, 6-diaminopimelate ligase n=1 Tax=Helicobacter sp. 13S00401-1 TaxID=1905758 RepID=UPI000BA671AE|nr:UDP-N-acetylmuramoyl-L-alanyl-D-glutamate--2,6-diaminopimelate ligase [Helicobacter sp. 13S00401-1]PAF51698.1 UDP-N-acetylmuramoylalanyl-D-glutamate--2,6-diaminopimelate ligase [Helicobacter sp. 13S00401-1]
MIKEFKGLKFSDDTRDLEKGIDIFVITAGNISFLDSINQSAYKTKFIDSSELKNYFKTDIKIVGITGTNGKTTTASAIYSTLLDLGYKCALLGTRGLFMNDSKIKPKGLTTPSLLDLYEDIDLACDKGCEYFVMEVSSHAIVQDRISSLNFALKAITNITSDHLDFHKTLENYIEAKLSFFQDDEVLKVINLDDARVARLRFYKKTYSYALDSKATLKVNAYSLTNGLDAQLTFSPPKSASQDAFLESSLYGVHNLYNAMCALTCVLLLTKRPLEEVCTAFSNFGGVSGRSEVVSTKPLIIVDFAHTQDGMLKMFESFKGRNIHVVFGAGGDRDKTKRPLMGRVAKAYASKIYVTSDNPRSEDPDSIIQDILGGMEDVSNVYVNADREAAIKQAITELDENCVLLILGKGDEEGQIFKNKVLPFSDKECVQKILTNISSTHQKLQ